MNTLEVTTVAIDTIIPYARNPRKNDRAVDEVAASIKEYGWRQPIVVDKDNVIVVGHTRYNAAKKLGLKEVPIHTATNLTEQQIKAYRIADNKTSEYAEWDTDLLQLELEEVDGLYTGFTQEEMDGLFGDEGKKKTDADPDDVPDAPVTPVSQLGDLWILGDHKVLCGDSTKAETFATLMETEIADMIWTDPPYNVAYTSPAQKAKQRISGSQAGHTEILNDNLEASNFQDFLNDAFEAGFAKLKPGGAIYVSYSDKEMLSFRIALLGNGIKMSSNLVWIKNHLMLSMMDYHPIHEPIMYGWKEGAAHYFVDDRTQTCAIDYAVEPEKMTKEELVKYVNSMKTSILRFDRTAHNDLHPTMKPVDLLERLISNSSRKDEIVLDLFGGSGSTLIACESIGRKARLVELETKYVDVIITRWQEYTGEKAKLNGKTFEEVKKERLK